MSINRLLIVREKKRVSFRGFGRNWYILNCNWFQLCPFGGRWFGTWKLLSYLVVVPDSSKSGRQEMGHFCPFGPSLRKNDEFTIVYWQPIC